MDLTFVLLYVTRAPFFCQDCHRLQPAATRDVQHGSPAQGGQLHRESFELWAGPMKAAWWEAPKGWCVVQETLSCLAAGGGSSVLHHSHFPLSCSQVFCLFSIVPFMCFPSLQKSLALFKIDSESLPRLYPERGKKKMHRGQVPIELSKAFTPHQDLWISQKSGLSGKALHSPRSPFWKSHTNISAQECALQLPEVSPVTSLWVPLQVSYTLCFLAFFAVRRIYAEKSWSYRKMAWGCLTQKTSNVLCL